MKHIITPLAFCALLGSTASAEQLPEWYYTTNNYKQLVDSIVFRYKTGDASTQNEALNVLVKRMATKKDAMAVLKSLAQTNKLVGEPAMNLFAELKKDPTNTKLLEFYVNNVDVVPETEFRELFKSEQVQNNTKARCSYEVILLKRKATDFIDIAIAEINRQLKSDKSVLEVGGLIKRLSNFYNKKTYGYLLGWAAQNANKYVVDGYICMDYASDDDDESERPCSPMYASVSRFILTQISRDEMVKGFPKDFKFKNDCDLPAGCPDSETKYVCADDKILSWCRQHQKTVAFNAPKPSKKQRNVSCKMARKDSYESVDLGLKVLWATYNVGAENDAQVGCYFAWGETEPKNYFDNLGYKYTIRTSKQLTKYNAKPETGVVDNLEVLEAADDAAAVNWGNGWHMPSVDDYNELVKNCDFVEVKNYKNSGIDGKLGTSKINGNTIFFPYTGMLYFGRSFTSKNTCHYWTNTVSDFQPMAYYWKTVKINDFSSEYRNCGCCIRAVKNK